MACRCSPRAAFSLLFDGTRQPARVLLLDRDKRTYIDLQKEKKAAKQDRKSEVRRCHATLQSSQRDKLIGPRRTMVLMALHAADARLKVNEAAAERAWCMPVQVNGLMSEGPGKTKMRMSDFHFKPMKTLLGRPSTEKIAGWRTQVTVWQCAASRRAACAQGNASDAVFMQVRTAACLVCTGVPGDWQAGGGHHCQSDHGTIAQAQLILITPLLPDHLADDWCHACVSGRLSVFMNAGGAVRCNL